MKENQVLGMKEAGVKAESLSSTATPAERSAILSDLESGHPKIRILYGNGIRSPFLDVKCADLFSDAGALFHCLVSQYPENRSLPGRAQPDSCGRSPLHLRFPPSNAPSAIFTLPDKCAP